MLDWRVMRLGLPVAMMIAVTGCGPIGQSGGDETLEPHFQTGRHRVGAMDYDGAVESFERALEINPRSASAHFELALLYEDKFKKNDPAAAIYHFQQFLKLKPGSERAEITRQKINSCRADLAAGAPVPLTGNQQQEISRLTAENAQLRRRMEQLEQMLAARPSAVTNYVIGTPTPAPTFPAGVSDLPAPPPLVPPTSAPKNTPATTPVAARTHTVKKGESFFSIARRYNVDPKKLQNANPGVNPDRMQIGQTLKVPAP